MLRPYRGRLPTVHPTAYVDESAQVIGDVEIGADSSVWMNVVVRGDVNIIRIGQRSNVQDGTVVHVMHDTHPTHHRRRRDDRPRARSCTAARSAIRVLIGMGAIAAQRRARSARTRSSPPARS